jgi:hypothetical protein
MAASSLRPVAADPWEIHAALLGASAASTVAPEAPSRFRVTMTFAGVVGDLGISAPGYYALVAGPSEGRIANGLLDHLAAGRPGARVACTLQPSLAPFGTMNAFGADASALLPPILPFGRNQDGLFCWMVRAIDPNACFAHLPLATTHRFGDARRFDLAEIGELGTRPRLSDLVRLLVVRALPAGPPATRLRALGRALDDEAPTLTLLEDLWNDQRAAWSSHAANGARNGPRGQLAELRAALARRLAAPIRLDPTVEGAPVVETIRRFGRLLTVWPAIWARAGARRLERQRAA